MFVPVYLVSGSNLLLGSTICRNAQKKEEKKLTGKSLNIDRQFFKDVICIF